MGIQAQPYAKICGKVSRNSPIRRHHSGLWRMKRSYGSRLLSLIRCRYWKARPATSCGELDAERVRVARELSRLLLVMDRLDALRESCRAGTLSGLPRTTPRPVLYGERRSSPDSVLSPTPLYLNHNGEWRYRDLEASRLGAPKQWTVYVEGNCTVWS